MNKIYRQKLIDMKNIDQSLRFKASPGKGVLNYLIFILDSFHGWRLRRLVKKYGYPNRELVGEDGMHAAWLLVQHQDRDIKLQEDFLRNCDFSKKDYAYLYDRIAVNKGEKQLFGTQFKQSKDNGFVPHDIADSETLNERRREMGLESFDEYKEKLLRLNS